jgi:YidC/Oxa1 family membrane protein insertase
MEQQDQRNLMLALVLMVLLLVGMQLLLPQAPRQQQQQQAQQQQEQLQQQSQFQSRNDIVARELAEGSRIVIDAPAVDGSISLIGGRIDDVSLRNHYDTIKDKLEQNKDGEIQLLSPPGADRAFYAVAAWSTEGGFSTEAATWTQTNTGALTPGNPAQLTYAGPSARIDRTVAVDSDYMFTITDTVTNTGEAPIVLRPTVQMRQRLLQEHVSPPQSELGSHRGVLGTYGDQKYQTISYNDLNNGKAISKSVTGGWNALTTKYWMAATIPEQTEEVQMIAGSEKLNGQTIGSAGYSLTPYTIQPGQSVTKVARIFAGAKRVRILDAYEQNGIPAFSDAVDWSWMFFITKPFFYLLQIFQGWSGSFGFAILILTVAVKTVFFPLQFRMYKSMSKMRLLAPEMKLIQERFAGDPQRMRQEQAKLWQREKVNPLSGCLPLLPTIFVFWALYHTLNVTLEMRHTPFPYTWIQDMSARDPVTAFNLFGLIPWDPGAIPLIGGFLMIGPFALLYGVTMILLQGMSAPPTDPMQRAIMRWIPLVFTILFAGFAAGLVIYWVWSNIITLGQQYIIMRRSGVETEFDKWLKKRFGNKKPPGDGGGKSERAPAG